MSIDKCELTVLKKLPTRYILSRASYAIKVMPDGNSSMTLHACPNLNNDNIHTEAIWTYLW